MSRRVPPKHRPGASGAGPADGPFAYNAVDGRVAGDLPGDGRDCSTAIGMPHALSCTRVSPPPGFTSLGRTSCVRAPSAGARLRSGDRRFGGVMWR